jgi:sugar lactone lactonase YvrE
MKIVPGLGAGLVYVTSQSDAIYLLDTATNQNKAVEQLDYRPAGIAIDAARKKLYVGATGRSVVYAYDIGPMGGLSNRTVAINQISQPTALLVDACGGLYVGGTDGGNLRRLAPDGALTVVARFDGPDITAMAFGSGKHGWSDHSLFALDTWVGTLYEVAISK